MKLGVPHSTFRVWKTWKSGAPELGVEVVSDSDEPDAPWEVKLERYRLAGIAEVVRFDPDDDERPIRVWDNIDDDLVERLPPEEGLFECRSLGLYWVAQPHPSFGRMLRLARDPEGRDLLALPDEAERAAWRAHAQEARARKEAEQARDRLAAEVAELKKQLARQQKAAAPRRPAQPKAASRRAPKKRA